jgi:hypothetical protein
VIDSEARSPSPAGADHVGAEAGCLVAEAVAGESAESAGTEASSGNWAALPVLVLTPVWSARTETLVCAPSGSAGDAPGIVLLGRLAAVPQGAPLRDSLGVPGRVRGRGSSCRTCSVRGGARARRSGDRGGRRGLGLEGWPSTWRAGRTASSRAPRSFAARGAGRDNRGAMAQTLGYVLVVLLIVYIAYAVDRRLVRHLVRVRVGRGSGFRACGRPSRASCQPRVGRPSRALSSSPFLGRTGPRRTLRDPRLRIRAVSRAASSADHAHPAPASASSLLA